MCTLDQTIRAWDQRIELNSRATRRRRHLILLDSLYGVSCLNFVDDDEVSIFFIFMSDVVGFGGCKRTPENFLWDLESIVKYNHLSREGVLNSDLKALPASKISQATPSFSALIVEK